MKTLKHLLFGVAASLCLYACNNGAAKSEGETEQAAAKGLEIPVLLDRPDGIGSPEEAQKMGNTYMSIKATIEQNPKDYASRLKMADLYIVEARATGNYNYYYPAAIDMIDRVLAENPAKAEDKFRAYSSKAVILLSLHKFEEAREMGRKALAINPNNSRVYGILTDANVELGDYERAVIMGDSMVQVRPDLRSYSRISYLREIYGEVEGAKEAMMMAVKAGYPGHEETSWARVTLGKIHESYGDLSSAEVQYQIALQNRKGYPFAVAGLGRVAAKKGNYEEAENLMKKAIDLRAEAGFYEDLALIYAAQDKEVEMKEARDMTFKMLKGLAGNHSHDDGHSHSHDGEEAHSHDHDHGHSHDADNAHGHSHEVGLEMAKSLMVLKEDYQEAMKHAMHEYERRPGNIEVNKALAHIYMELGELEKAEEHLAKARQTGSEDPELYLIAGKLKMKQGDEAAAKGLLKKGIEMNPYQMTPLAREAKKILG